MTGTAIYETIEHTHEELANVLGIVYTAIQFIGRALVVDPDLSQRGIRYDVWARERISGATYADRLVPSRTLQVEYLWVTVSGLPLQGSLFT